MIDNHFLGRESVVFPLVISSKFTSSLNDYHCIPIILYQVTSLF